MDGRRVDAFARWLSGGSSRRSAVGLALAGLLGPLSLGNATAKNKKHHKPAKRCGHCGECRHCVKGRCQAVGNGVGCGTGTCLGGQCFRFATCSIACPSNCQLCLTNTDGDTFCANSATSRCTGQPCRILSDCGVDAPFASACVVSVTDRASNTISQGCEVAVGTGVCWDFTPCISCAEHCPAACSQCLNLADGGTRCTGASESCTATPCTANADCPDAPLGAVCAISVTDRATSSTRQGCGAAAGTGICWSPTICSIG